jgi:hypothetical protein
VLVRVLYRNRRWNAIAGATRSCLVGCAVGTVAAFLIGSGNFDRVFSGPQIAGWVILVLVIIGAVEALFVVRLRVQLADEVLEIGRPLARTQVEVGRVVGIERQQVMNGTYCVRLVMDSGEKVRVLAVPFQRRDVLAQALPRLGGAATS